MAELDVKHVITAVRAHVDEWHHAGVRWRLTAGSAREETVASLVCDNGGVTVHLTVRADGDTAMTVTRRSEHGSSRYHYRLTSAGDADGCLRELTRQLIPGGTS